MYTLIHWRGPLVALFFFTEKDDNQSITQLLTKDIDTLETKAIQALRRNFDPDDILNEQKMAEPENICDINENLHMCNFDLNSVVFNEKLSSGSSFIWGS
mgnify:CR=1 FL=1